ncbi:MAG: N-acetylmuramoyl-L-alanine amidase [Candidatus Omnitrophica bacterium]|nr:N-acetylmuramoyl-L-alanine amidase [Candidatus Omnitrophota bacterium]MCM8828429.1 N-acetylmuramoyl-L-alanine amidase [Candidatus Omnitrophota bacterium]
MKSISKCLFVFFLFCSLLFSSDFTNQLKNYPVYWIGKQKYVSLQTVIKILGVGSWGRIEDRIFIEYQGRILKSSVGSFDFYVDEKHVNLDSPIREIEKEIFIPVEPFDQIISTITPSVPQKTPAKPAASAADVEKEKTAVTLKSTLDRDFIILIDPGHGGHDNGAVGNYGLKEKDVNLDISLRLRNHLAGYFKKGSKVIIKMTREDDRFLSLDERVEIAKKEKADIFFCVHTNSSRLNRWNADGFETYYPSKKSEISFTSMAQPDESAESETNTEVVFQIVSELNSTSVIEESRILAEIVQEKLAERLICPDRGAKPASFYVLRYTPMVSVLVEVGFICNPNIEANLRDPEVRQAISETLGKAVIQYLKSKQIIE